MAVRSFRVALQMGGFDVEEAEAECFVANMIYNGLIKGYISHEKQIVVLGANAFPRTADRTAPLDFL